MVAQVTINVTQVNDPPTASPQNLKVPPGGSREILLSGTDPEDSILVFQITELPAHGTLTGIPPLVLYSPQAAFVGMDSFSFRAHDGVLESAPATVTLEVTPPICVPPTTGLLAWWRAEGDVIDAVGGFDGTAAPGLTYASGKVGQAFACGGTSAAVRCRPPRACKLPA